MTVERRRGNSIANRHRNRYKTHFTSPNLISLRDSMAGHLETKGRRGLLLQTNNNFQLTSCRGRSLCVGGNT